ncbi:hypothetical protein niasHT_028897 [Heterodera trifolii]|uniref:Uncharacterized protein n=1 Tax=Heterodera trifolii TaxID=157864 RepID=A0ABD2KEY8_9BILA
MPSPKATNCAINHRKAFVCEEWQEKALIFNYCREAAKCTPEIQKGREAPFEAAKRTNKLLKYKKGRVAPIEAAKRPNEFLKYKKGRKAPFEAAKRPNAPLKYKKGAKRPLRPRSGRMHPLTRAPTSNEVLLREALIND